MTVYEPFPSDFKQRTRPVSDLDIMPGLENTRVPPIGGPPPPPPIGGLYAPNLDPDWDLVSSDF